MNFAWNFANVLALDEEPKTLYVNRPLTNGQVLLDWAKSQGFKILMPVDDLHVTLAFSKTPVDWDKIQDTKLNISIEAGTEDRVVEPLGDQGAVVLRFDSQELKDRWQELCDIGAKWDWPEYKSHVSFTYDGKDVDLSKVIPYDGPLEFGPERMKEVDSDWAAKVKQRQVAQDNSLALAFDKATVRNIDANGHLHVATTNISKANVCPYYGREIPGYEELGLDEDKIYQLLRDPEELAKAAATFNGKPVLSKHVPVSSADHHPELVIGAIGTDAEFTAPYLRNSLVIWAQPDIDAIESEEKRELSSAYRYRADMTPGTYEGVKFDGVMRDLIGNHVAIVKEGRAGSDVVVGDAAIFPQLKELTMTKVLMSRRAVQTQGALAVYLLPKLAQDAKIDLAPMLKDVTNKNFKAKKKDLIEGVTKITKGKLAQDASLADLDKLLDALGGSEVPEAATGEDKEVVDPNMKEPMEKQPTVDADPAAALMEFLKGKGMSDEDVAAACAMMKPAAVDEDPNDNEEQEGGAMDKDGPEMKPDMVSKKEMATAMDAAIKKVTEANDKRQQELRAAERAVKPYVGELAMDHKTADEVYRATLGALGVEGVEAIHPSAYPAILKSIPLPGAKTNNSNSEVAMDAAAFTSYDKMFPNASRIGNL